MRNYLLYALLRVGAWLVARLPVRAAYALASATASVAFAFARSPRLAMESNLALAFPGIPAGVRRRIALAAFRHNALNWMDTLRIPALDPSAIPVLVDVDRWDLVQDAIDSGSGAVIAMFHVGNYDLVGQALAVRGLTLSVPVERVRPERLYRFLVERRAAQGIHLLSVEHASRGLMAALRRGEVVGIAADRLVSGRGVEVTYFGRRCQFARGPAALARRSGAALLVGVGIRVPGRPFRGYILPVNVPRTADAHADEIDATQRLAAIAEIFVRAYPEQWLAFSPICSERGTPADAPATISQQKEAAR